MKVSRSLLLAALIIVVSSAGLRLGYEARKTRVGTRVLFVGNSFTFVNNLPAVFAALASANGFPVATDMLVRSGASLTDRIADTSLPRLLEKQHYDYVVLQERAGAVLCGQPHEKGSADPCGLSRQAHRQSADLARAHGAEPIVLGTYASAELAQAMQTNESFLAREVGATYIPIAERLVRAMQQAPELNWLAADGGHPGHDLTLLDAIALHQAIFRAPPKVGVVRVRGPIYDISTAIFTLDWRQVPAAANEYTYDEQRVARVITLASQ